MFNRFFSQQINQQEYCFVELNRPLTRDEHKLIRLLSFRKEEYFLDLFISSQELFVIHDTLPDTEMHTNKHPYGHQYISEESFNEIRYIAELNMSSQAVKNLFVNLKMKLHGKEFIDPKKSSKVYRQLMNHFVGLHIDVKNNETKQWERFDTIEKQSLLISTCTPF